MVFYSVRFEMDTLKFTLINQNGYEWKTKFDSVEDSCSAKEQGYYAYKKQFKNKVKR